MEEHGAGGGRPLHWAAYEGQVEAMEALVELGADIEAKMDAGDTPLHTAAVYGHVDAVKALVALGADMQATATDGATALHLAADYGHSEAVQALLELRHSQPEHKELEHKEAIAFTTLGMLLLILLGLLCYLPPRSLRKKARRQRGAAKAPSAARRSVAHPLSDMIMAASESSGSVHRRPQVPPSRALRRRRRIVTHSGFEFQLMRL